MQKLIVYSITFIFLINAKAQNSLETQLKDAKFDIIKKTVEFLSTDAATYKNVKATTCPDCKNLDDLKKFATTNGLLHADTKIIEPLGNVPLDTAAEKWQDGLLKFKQQAINKITGADKEKRKSLPGYATYEQTLSNICSAVKAGNIDETTAASVAANADTATTPAANNSPVKSTSSFTVPYWLLYGIIAILAPLSIFTWLENKKNKQEKNSLQEDKTNLKSSLHEAKQEVGKLKNKISKLEKEAKDRELDIQTLEDRLKLVENEKKILPQSLMQSEEPTPAISLEKEIPSKPVSAAQTAPAAVTKYARYADLGDGFSNTELLETPDSETIFELIIYPNNTGTYKVVNNPDGQKYALSNAQYFLAKSCRYDSFPAGNTRIQTDEPGLIKLIAGKWTITNPAKISFS